MTWNILDDVASDGWKMVRLVSRKFDYIEGITITIYNVVVGREGSK